MILTSNQRKRWQIYVNAFKRELPPSHPVIITTCKLSCDDVGSIIFKKNKFIIRINKLASYAIRQETLIHEYAHVLDWNNYQDTEDEFLHHSDSWGVYYARVYRVWLKHHLRTIHLDTDDD